TRSRRGVQGGSSSTRVPSASRKTARVIALILPDGMNLAVQESFWQQHGDEISAAITLAVAILVAIIVDRVLIGRAVKATTRLDTGERARQPRPRRRLSARFL